MCAEDNKVRDLGIAKGKKVRARRQLERHPLIKDVLMQLLILSMSSFEMSISDSHESLPAPDGLFIIRSLFSANQRTRSPRLHGWLCL